METKPKDPKKVEQGKKLAEFNRVRCERLLRLEAEDQRKEDEEFEIALAEFERWKMTNERRQDNTLTINDETQEEDNKKPVTQPLKTNIIIPLAVTTIIGVGIGLTVYKPDLLYRKTKRK